LQTIATGQITINRSGFIYVYTSNESLEDVFFDNLVVQHFSGPVLEETHYYPFGLTMSGISSAMAGVRENRYKFNGIELNNDLDLNSYEALYRNLDPQIGRWWQIDPKPNVAISPYASMENNPFLNADPLGDTIIFHPSVTKEFEQAFAVAALRLIERGQGKELAQLFFSKQEYVVKEFNGTNSVFKGNFTYDKDGNITGGNGGEISWNPNIGKETETGESISPTVVLNHELDHAARFDKDPVGFAKDATTPDAQYGTKEEKRVITGSEQRTARGLKEIGSDKVTRRSHEFKNQLLVNDPRSNKGTVISPYYNLGGVQITAPKKKK
jgi:RHS repeat-associated protein